MYFCRYQALTNQCKDTIDKWETICDEHRTYSTKRTEISKLLDNLEKQFSDLQNETDSDVSKKVKKLQHIIAERDQNANKVSEFLLSGESLFPDTAASGREDIRNELKDIKERLIDL